MLIPTIVEKLGGKKKKKDSGSLIVFFKSSEANHKNSSDHDVQKSTKIWDL